LLSKTTSFKRDLKNIIYIGIFLSLITWVFFTIISALDGKGSSGWINYSIIFIIVLYISGYIPLWIKTPRSSLLGALRDLTVSSIAWICMSIYSIVFLDVKINDPKSHEWFFMTGMATACVFFPLLHLCYHFWRRCPYCANHSIVTRRLNTDKIGNQYFNVAADRSIDHYDSNNNFTGTSRYKVQETRSQSIYEHSFKCDECGNAWSIQNNKKNDD